MSLFFSVFFKVSGFLFSILLFILVIIGISSYINNNSSKDFFQFVEGDQNSENSIIIFNISGPIINDKMHLSNITNIQNISPNQIKDKLEIIKNINPKILLISIDSPGGTVSASNEIYNILIDFLKNNKIKVYFHTDEILASGAYWFSMAGEKIYASYGALIGSIGVRGPDWFFYDNPSSISTGILGETIETKNGIKVYSQYAGNSKDLLNPFREPTKKELEHLKSLIDTFYLDFVNLVSKHRSIERKILYNKIGALIYNSEQAKNNFLVDDVLSLDNLIKKITTENKFKDYQILENLEKKQSLFNRLFIKSNKYQHDEVLKSEICTQLKTNLVSIYSFNSVGC
tara:strand:- start:184 stop:1215 length:1032 start_codon:yes stop_codon:yes gene_type:complete